jgi:hypothetical protein
MTGFAIAAVATAKCQRHAQLHNALSDNYPTKTGDYL